MKGSEKVSKRKSATSSEPVRKGRPALTPEARENQMVALAVNLAEQQLRDGTASSQVITHYLKLGSTMQKLEREKLEEENKLLRAKTESLQSAKNIEELYTKAIAAIMDYSGRGGEIDEEY